MLVTLCKQFFLGWLVGWIVVWFIHGLIDRLIIWSNQLIDCISIDWPDLTDWLINWLIDRLIDCIMMDRLAIYWFTDRPIDGLYFDHSIMDGSIDEFDWLIDWWIPAGGADDQHQLQCSECGKSFRTETLLDYHNKYYHHHHHQHVTAGDTAGSTSAVTSRRPSGSVDRGTSARSRSKNKSTCKLTFLQLSY